MKRANFWSKVARVRGASAAGPDGGSGRRVSFPMQLVMLSAGVKFGLYLDIQIKVQMRKLSAED